MAGDHHRRSGRRDPRVDFVADAPGDWAFHCHKSHHTMNAMGHQVVNVIGVRQRDLSGALQPRGADRHGDGNRRHGRDGHHVDAAAANTLPMMTGTGPFGPIEMGGMFTVMKVREGLAAGDYSDPGRYKNPPGTVAHEVKVSRRPANRHGSQGRYSKFRKGSGDADVPWVWT